MFWCLKNAIQIFTIVRPDNVILKTIEMVGNDIVNVTEQRHFIITDYLYDFQYPVVKFLADINRFAQSRRYVTFPDKQGFVIMLFSFASVIWIWAEPIWIIFLMTFSLQGKEIADKSNRNKKGQKIIL